MKNLKICAIISILLLSLSPSYAIIFWNIRAPIPTSRSHFGVGMVGGRIYCFGGSRNWDGNVIIRSHEVYNPITNSWSAAASMLYPRKAFASAVANGKIYAIGGIDSTINNNGSPRNEEYDPGTNTWAARANLPTTRYGVSAATVNNKIYVIGGRIGPAVGGQNTNVNQEYDPATNTWNNRAPMPESLRYVGAVSYGGKVYIIGGSRNNGTRSDKVYIYDPATNTWTMAPPLMITPRSTIMPDSVRNFLLAPGGASAATPQESNVAELFFPATSNWISETPMNYARFALGFARTDSFFYAIGGTTGTGTVPLNYNEGGIYVYVAILVDPNQSDSTLPGVTKSYTLTVTNQGDRPDVVDITTSGTLPGWTVGLYQANGSDTLTDTDSDGVKDVGQVSQQGGTVNFVVKITPPVNAPQGQTDNTTVRGTSSIDITKFDTALLTTRVMGFASILVDPDTLGTTSPGVAVDYSLRAINNGNLVDTVNLSSSHTAPSWQAQILDSTGTTPITRLAVSPFGGTRRFVLRITPPDTVIAGTEDTTFVRGVSTFNATVKDSARVITQISGFASLLIEPDTLGTTLPGVDIAYPLRAINNGNVQDTVNLSSSHTTPGWTAEILDSTGITPINRLPVPPYGGTRRLVLRITPPDTVLAGTRDTTFVRGISTYNSTVHDSAQVITVIGAFASLLVEPDTSSNINPGNTINYQLRVINQGNSIDSISLTLTSFHPAGWNTQLLDSLGSPVNMVILSPYGSLAHIILRVSAPVTAGPNEKDSSIVKGVSSINPSVTDQATVVTLIGIFAQIAVEPNSQKSGLPGDTVTYILYVENQGNAQDLIDLSLTSTQGWEITTITDTLGNPLPDNNGNGKQDVTLLPNDSAWIKVRVVIPPGTQAGSIDSTIVLGESNNIIGVRDDAILVTTTGSEVLALTVDPNATQRINAGTSHTYRLYVVLNANTADTVDLSLGGLPTEWQAELLSKAGTPINKVFAQPGIADTFTVRVTAPQITIVGPPQDIIDKCSLVVRGTSRLNTQISDIATLITLATPGLDVHNFASPFRLRDGTTFIMSLPEHGKVSITVFNRLGEKVKTVVTKKDYDAGVHLIPWNAKNEKGNAIVPGVYIYVFEFEGTQINKTIKKRTAVLAR